MRVVLVVWAVLLVLLMRHREVISTDTLSNYVHVWFVADSLWGGDGLPYRMPVLASGDALAFPYAFVPWMVAVLLWPVLGEYAVTLCLGAGFVGLVAATFWALPELRRGWWAAAVLVNPALVEGLMLGQLPFVWGAAMLYAAIGCWRRGRHRWAVVLAGLAQFTHVVVLGPLTAFVVLCRVPFEPDRRRLVRSWLVSMAAALPAAWLMLASPVTSQVPVRESLWTGFSTVGLRTLVLMVPFGLLALQRRGMSVRAPAVVALVLVVGQAAAVPVSSMGVGWGAVGRRPDPAMASIPESAAFVPGATYRVLSAADGKYGPYAVVRAGGRLDSEFFPESMHRRGFRDEEAYARFLTGRSVDFVVSEDRYQRFGTNERALLDAMSTSAAGCRSGVRIERLANDGEDRYRLYRVQRGCGPAG